MNENEAAPHVAAIARALRPGLGADGMSDLQPQPCGGCGRDSASVLVAFHRNTSLLIRRLGDMGHANAADVRCVDCIADMADEVAAGTTRPFHRDFGGKR